MVHTVQEESDQRCLRAERRWSRTGDPILTIDARAVHNATQHLTCPHDRAGESRCREVSSRAA
jgi:hypothetical protein